ncbi:MAG: DUF1573 domain-containing protein [Thermoplasmata archaeon]
MVLENCPLCSVKVKPENLPNHIRKVHPGANVEEISRERGQRKSRERETKSSRKVLYTVLIVFILVVGALFVYTSISSPGSPEISLNPISYNFGDIPQDEVSTTIQVTNIGDSDLIITGISTSCGCTSAVLRVGGRTSGPFGMHDNPPWGWSETLLPGQLAFLDITYDAGLHPDTDQVLRVVYIRSNDPARPEVEIELRANVIP